LELDIPSDSMMHDERRWIYKETDMDVLIYEMVDMSGREFYDNVQEVDYDEI
jgi:hypothetical protein